MEQRLQLALAAADMVAWDLDIRTRQVVCSESGLNRPSTVGLTGIYARRLEGADSPG